MLRVIQCIYGFTIQLLERLDRKQHFPEFSFYLQTLFLASQRKGKGGGSAQTHEEREATGGGAWGDVDNEILMAVYIIEIQLKI